jgi:periplasmic protein CpxP/Spy
MKSQSVIRYVASMLLIPATGFAIINSAAHFSPALADSLSSSTSILAQNAPTQTPAEKQERGNRGEKMFQQLNLSADQQAQIKSIKAQAKTSNQALRQQLKTAREQLKALLASSDASDSALRQAHQQLQPLSQQMSDQRFDTMLKIRNVLTPAQRTKLAELRKQGGYRHHRQDRAAKAKGTLS